MDLLILQDDGFQEVKAKDRHLFNISILYILMTHF